MNKKQQFGFGHIALLILIIVIAIIGFAGYQVLKHNKNNGHGGYSFYGGNSSNSRDYALAGGSGDSSAKNLPSCSGTGLLNHMPLSDVNSIEGLGHTNGEHIIPGQADHIYLFPSSSDSSVTTYAPGDVTLLQVVQTKHIGGRDTGTDYTVYFSPCKSVMFGLSLKSVGSAISSAMAAAQPKCDTGTLVSNCTYEDLSLKLTAGEVMGSAQTGGTGTDFAGADVRTPTLAYINQQDPFGGMLADSYAHTVCPLDYFTGSVKSQLYAKLATRNAGAHGIPACGAVMQDKAGTAQGNWYMPGVGNTSQGDGLTKIMALAHYNLDPSQAVISAGSKLLPSNDFGAQIFYTPKSSGYVNRDPSDIKPDGHTYCIEGTENMNQEFSHVDLQLTNATTLKADYGSGSCSVAPTLSASAITWNR